MGFYDPNVGKWTVLRGSSGVRSLNDMKWFEKGIIFLSRDWIFGSPCYDDHVLYVIRKLVFNSNFLSEVGEVVGVVESWWLIHGHRFFTRRRLSSLFIGFFYEWRETDREKEMKYNSNVSEAQLMIVLWTWYDFLSGHGQGWWMGCMFQLVDGWCKKILFLGEITHTVWNTFQGFQIFMNGWEM
jgi:hypothetical protein